MGTNYYKLDGTHIGKRSAAGAYCWDCNITLCKNGDEGIHSEASYWHDKCPKCGKDPINETLENNAAGRELGFNETKPKPKKGVKSCSSFIWGVRPDSIKNIKFVKNEYGDKITKVDFMHILTECPVMFFDSIGEEFS